MQKLNSYLVENLTNKQNEIIGKIFDCVFKKTRLSKDVIKQMLSNLDKDIIYTISKYFNDNDSSDYLSYSPNEDEFLNYEDNKDKIISQISEYISKYKIE